MSSFFDALIDTRAKRYHASLLALLVVCIIISLTYLCLGILLWQIKDYDDAFALLDQPLITLTYFARIVLDAMSMPAFELWEMVACLIRNISTLEILALFFGILCYPTLEKKKATLIALLLLVVEVFACGGLCLAALSSASFGGAIQKLQLMGMLIVSIQIVLLIMLIYYLILQLKAYRQALSYQAVEVKEHEVS